MTLQQIRERLQTLAEPRLQAFSASLLPGVSNILGVRLPKLRQLAREIARTDARERIVNSPEPPHSMEEHMLRGMLTGYAPERVGFTIRAEELKRFIPSINNWSVCDSCCATYKFVRAEREKTWKLLQEPLHSDKEFEVRFGVVMLLNHFLQTKEWAERVADELSTVKAEGYYAEMAIAWCMCELYLQHPFLSLRTPAPHTRQSPRVQQLTIRKLKESRRKGAVDIIHNLHA